MPRPHLRSLRRLLAPAALPLALVFALFLAGCTTAPRPVSLDLPATDEGQPGVGPIRRQDWFQKLWHDRRTEFAAHAKEDRHALVFLGDSITQGWGPRLAAAFPTLKVANRGISGDTTRGVLIRLQQDVLALDPAGVVLLIGTNDLADKATPEMIAGNITLLLDAMQRHNPSMPVILCEVFPSSPEKDRAPADIKRINYLLRSVARGRPQVTYLDTWTLFAGPDGNAKPGEFPDLLHPNDAGYAKLAGALRPALATLNFLDREDDEFTIENDFTPLFNGHNLDGWGYRPTPAGDMKYAQQMQRGSPANVEEFPIVTTPVNFDGRTATPDGRFVALHGRLVVTTPRGYRKIQQLYTQREFPHDFVLKLEFRATPNTDSGIYIRGPQLQCRDYLLAGPYKKLQHYRPGEWNEIVVTVTGNVAHCTCNGEVLEDALKLPATGPIGLEGDRGQMEYRRIRIQTRP
ncbi:MAG TPA: GDSL-type esterase/lipase family protein [Lacunisphaera sp.]|jgi:lysophospholipase L1-like esterase|nr:GDSL-type esterase/lipase family protein [Lacunisphaera sp.]